MVKKMTKLERVNATLNHQPVDRCALLEQLSYNPDVIADWTGKQITGFNYTLDDICEVIDKTMDLIMPPVAPRGTEKFTDDDGFVSQNDNWTTWHVSKPFSDEIGAAKWLIQRMENLKKTVKEFDPEKCRDDYRCEMLKLQQKIGDTVILNYGFTGHCSIYDSMGLEIFTYFQLDNEELFKEYLDTYIEYELKRIHAIADVKLSPVILVAEDFATKQGPIFSPDYLKENLFPYIAKVTEAWHKHDIKVIYHSDGNWKKMVPDLLDTGVDGFYCLEKNCGMDVVELKNQYPQAVWAGGVDGVDLMEFSGPEDVEKEVIRHITETNALETGGMFVASSSEINPTVKSKNFRAMVETVWKTENKE